MGPRTPDFFCYEVAYVLVKFPSITHEAELSWTLYFSKLLTTGLITLSLILVPQLNRVYEKTLALDH